VGDRDVAGFEGKTSTTHAPVVDSKRKTATSTASKGWPQR